MSTLDATRLDATRPTSTRVSLARLAERVLASTPGVGPTRGGGRWLTRDGERTIDGVVVGLTSVGRADIALHLVGSWPPEPLPPLAAQLRRELIAAALSAGLDERLGEIEISFHDLEAPAADAGGSR